MTDAPRPDETEREALVERITDALVEFDREQHEGYGPFSDRLSRIVRVNDANHAAQQHFVEGHGGIVGKLAADFYAATDELSLLKRENEQLRREVEAHVCDLGTALGAIRPGPGLRVEFADDEDPTPSVILARRGMAQFEETLAADELARLGQEMGLDETERPPPPPPPLPRDVCFTFEGFKELCDRHIAQRDLNDRLSTELDAAHAQLRAQAVELERLRGLDEMDLLAANEGLGEAMVEIGLAVGLRPHGPGAWCGKTAILAELATLRAGRVSGADTVESGESNETYRELRSAVDGELKLAGIYLDRDAEDIITEALIEHAEADRKVSCPYCPEWSRHGPGAERKVIEHWFRAHQPVDPDLARLRDELNEALGESHAARRDDTELVQTVRAERELVQQAIQGGFLSFDDYQPAPPSISLVPEQGREEGQCTKACSEMHRFEPGCALYKATAEPVEIRRLDKDVPTSCPGCRTVAPASHAQGCSHAPDGALSVLRRLVKLYWHTPDTVPRSCEQAMEDDLEKTSAWVAAKRLIEGS